MTEHIVDFGTDDESFVRIAIAKQHGAELRGGIVRCADCDLSHEDELGDLRCHGPLTEPWDYYSDEPSDGVKVEPSGFCAWAVKRKEGGE